LTAHLASQLLHDIGVAPALLDTQCNRDSLPYYPFSDEVGWNKGIKQKYAFQTILDFFCFVIKLDSAKMNMEYPNQKNFHYKES
jgi:hypothetical protein